MNKNLLLFYFSILLASTEYTRLNTIPTHQLPLKKRLVAKLIKEQNQDQTQNLGSYSPSLYDYNEKSLFSNKSSFLDSIEDLDPYQEKQDSFYTYTNILNQNKKYPYEFSKSSVVDSLGNSFPGKDYSGISKIFDKEEKNQINTGEKKNKIKRKTKELLRNYIEAKKLRKGEKENTDFISEDLEEDPANEEKVMITLKSRSIHIYSIERKAIPIQTRTLIITFITVEYKISKIKGENEFKIETRGDKVESKIFFVDIENNLETKDSLKWIEHLITRDFSDIVSHVGKIYNIFKFIFKKERLKTEVFDMYENYYHEIEYDNSNKTYIDSTKKVLKPNRSHSKFKINGIKMDFIYEISWKDLDTPEIYNITASRYRQSQYQKVDGGLNKHEVFKKIMERSFTEDEKEIYLILYKKFETDYSSC